MQTAAVVIAAVGALGIGAQWIAWRTNWPAIVLMLAAGFLAGPILGLFDPEETFGSLLEPMIGIGVALILFEGGLSLSFRELQHSGSAVWRLATIGVAVGWALGAVTGYYVAGLVWPVAILFGGILVVTGPTVVLPLLRQSNVQTRPASILKWEAIVNDPTGALCAVIAYEYFRKVAEAPGASLFEVVPPLIVAVAGFAWIYDALQLEFGRRDFSMSERALTQLRVVFFYASLVLLLPILLPVAILVVPLLDLVLAVVRRTRAGRSPFAPDKQHLHHRLLEIGHSQRRAVFIMWLWAGLVAFGTVLVSLYSGPFVVGGVVAATLFTVALTFLLPRLHRSGLEA